MGYPAIFPTVTTKGCQGLPAAAVSYLASMQAPLNTVIENATHSAGGDYVDPNAGPHSFLGHDVCAPASERWFNGANVTGEGPGASFQPNAQGQAALAATLEMAIAKENPPVTPGPKNNVLIYGSGDPHDDPTQTSFQNISAALVGLGDTTTLMPLDPSLPSQVERYGQVWLNTESPIPHADEWTLEAFVRDGGSLYVNGGWGTTSSFDNQSVQDLLNALVPNPPSVTGTVMQPGTPNPVNTSVIDGLATTPNQLTSWLPNEPGELTGVAPENVLFSDGTGASGAAWEVGSRGGRLVVLMDEYWAQTAFMDPTTMPEVAANIGSFLNN